MDFPYSDRAEAMSAVPVYRGHFGRQEAERLLWRAGFGPRPGEADASRARDFGAPSSC